MHLSQCFILLYEHPTIPCANTKKHTTCINNQCKFLNSVIIHVRHKYIAATVEGHRLRIVQLARCCSTFTRASYHTLKTVRCRSYDPMIVTFHDKQIVMV
jgi:hypothetical protein